MRSFENIIMIFILALFLLLASVLTLRGGISKQEGFARDYAEQMLLSIKAEGEINVRHIEMLSNELFQCGYTEGFYLTAYYYESGKDGKEHQYSISYGEILEELQAHGSFPVDVEFIEIYVPGKEHTNFVSHLIFGRNGFKKNINI